MNKCKAINETTQKKERRYEEMASETEDPIDWSHPPP